MSWVVWRNRYREGFCALGALENVPRDEEILKGASRAGDFPSAASYAMRADFPKDTKVADNAYTMIHHVVSAPLRALLEPELGKSRVEFLPVRIRDHAGRAVEGAHFVLNPLDVLDAIDVEASNVDYNDLDPTQLCMCEQLVLKPLPDEVTMFRPHNWTRIILVREEIADKLKEAGLSGLAFTSAEDYSG